MGAELPVRKRRIWSPLLSLSDPIVYPNMITRTLLKLDTEKQWQIQRLLVSNKLTSHRESTDKQSDVPSTDHDAFASVSAIPNTGVLVFPGCPDPHEKNQDVEDHNSHETLGVNGHLPFVRFLPPRSSAVARRGLEFHGENFEEKNWNMFMD